MAEACRAKIAPKQVRQKICHKACILFHITYVKELMHRCNLSVKKATQVHVMHAVYA